MPLQWDEGDGEEEATRSNPRFVPNLAKRWGVSLHDATLHLGVRCYTCQATGLLSAPVDEGAVPDCAAWPTVACMMTDGCDGVVVPEALN
ncbi:MAG: hypothetical protein V4510_00320 [bacterium]